MQHILVELLRNEQKTRVKICLIKKYNKGCKGVPKTMGERKMRIRKATKKDLKESLNIAKELNEWFNKEGIKNMWTDFLHNNTIVYSKAKSCCARRSVFCRTPFCIEAYVNRTKSRNWSV